jgi:hypothetical protein
MNLSLEPQNNTCPKCQYTRKITDMGSDFQCPFCGVVYEKYIHHHEDIQHPEYNQNNHLRLTSQVALSRWEKFKLVVCLSPFFAIGVGFTMMDSISEAFHKPLGGWLAVLIFSSWMIYRIANALRSGVLYTRGRYSTKGNWYCMESAPYMFWQTIIMWMLGIVAYCMAFVLLA